MSLIAYYMDQNWTLWEVQLMFDVVDSLFFSCFNGHLEMIG